MTESSGIARVASLGGKKGCGQGKEVQKGMVKMRGAQKGVEPGV